MEVQLFGAAKEVTGSCYSLTTKKNEKILIDCGMFQGHKDKVRENYDDFGFNPADYNALLLTHAHLDHCGRIPKLIKEGFKGKIYATNAAKDLAFVILMDAAKLAAEDTEHKNWMRAKEGLPPRKPIYNEGDVKETMKHFVAVDYDKEVAITDNITATFYNAGHILGASSIQLKIKEGGKTSLVVFSGDLGQENAVLVKNIEPIKKADYVFVESTYGNKLHPPIEERKKEFIRIVNEAYKSGGKLMIPSFAVERVQELLFYIGEFMQDGLIPKMKVFLDSPMAIKATAVFEKYKPEYNSVVEQSMKRRADPFKFPQLIFTQTAKESKTINSITGPCIIIAGNGMCSAGRIKQHIKLNIGSEKNTLMLIGYQAEGTLGYWLKHGVEQAILLGTKIDIKAKIEFIEGFSAHADYNDLKKWLNNFSPKPKKVFVCHGEDEQSASFAENIHKDGFDSYVPSQRELLELD